MLFFPNLVSEKTEFEILRDSEVINMVGLMFFHEMIRQDLYF